MWRMCEAAGFYRRFGLEPSPKNPFDLMITVNDLRVPLPPGGRARRHQGCG
ncbi:MAG: hypothetical protein ACRDXC_10170 [Acidimicrobiales bacterium]